MADNTRFSFPETEYRDATKGREKKDWVRLLASDPSIPGHIRFRDDWFAEHKAASLLLGDESWFRLKPGPIEKWLGAAKTPRDAQQAEAVVELAVIRACVADRSRLDSLLASAGPNLARIAAQAAVHLPAWLPTQDREAGRKAVWSSLTRTRTRSAACFAAIVEGAAAPLEGSTGDAELAKFLAFALAHPASDVRTAALAALQDRVAGEASRPLPNSGRALAPLVELSRAPVGGGWRRLPLLRLPERFRRLRAIGEGAWVTLAEAARVSRTDPSGSYLDGTAGEIAAILREVCKSPLLNFFFGDFIRPTLFRAFARVIADWFVRFTPKHNPFRLRREFKKFFALDAQAKQPLADIANEIGRDKLSAELDTARILDITRVIHAQPEIAYPPLISALETAWGTLPELDPLALASLFAALERQFREDLADERRHPYAQSCIFITFHLIRRYQRHALQLGVERGAKFEAVIRGVIRGVDGHTRFRSVVLDWLGKSQGGLYRSPGGSSMRIMHLFRAGLLEQQLVEEDSPSQQPGKKDSLLDNAIRLMPVLDRERTHRLETLLEEVFHLGYEFDAWDLTGRWLRDWFILVEEVETESARKRLHRLLARELRRLGRRRRAVAQRLLPQLDELGVRLESRTGTSTEKSLPPMLGVSTAAEDFWYQALAESKEFRKWWAQWIAKGAQVSSYAAWMRAGLHIAFNAAIGDKKRA
jgi:hypothetical protein